MNSFAQIIDQLGGAAEVAKFISERRPADEEMKRGTVQQMKARDSVHPFYWPDLIAMAQERRLDGVTHEVLIALAARRRSAA